MMRLALCLALSGWIELGTPAFAQAPAPTPEREEATQSELEPAVETSPASETLPPARGGVGRVRAADRIELDATQITGNRELPKVLYIVPWKRSDLGELVGKPVNSLLDEVLAPVDRDVFKRENRYYRALQPDDADAAGTRPVVDPPAGDES